MSLEAEVERGQYQTSPSANSRIKLQALPDAKKLFCCSLEVLSTLGTVLILWGSDFLKDIFRLKVKRSLKQCDYLRTDPP